MTHQVFSSRFMGRALPALFSAMTVFSAVASGSLTSASAQEAQQAGAAGMAPTAAKCPIEHDKLVEFLKKNVKASGGPSNGGLDTNEWAAVITRDGTVCTIAYSGEAWDSQWLASRAIAAEKAYTANAFSLKDKAMATANLYAGSQPGGFLYGLLTGTPADPSILYAGDASKFGSSQDPLIGKRTGGIITFGGGLALYDANGIVGAIGVSGDTSCADHNVAWRIRHAADLDHATGGVDDLKDGILYDIGLTGSSASGFGHPKCAGKEADIAKEIGSGK